ncbi:MAG TPA: choice-of-anchor Q domain-containing protein, partial [Solirubrobacterales bacterium]|nr:choice-of-anchor Q domain-containing protein [Solirubrobacterales bacterium]
ALPATSAAATFDVNTTADGPVEGTCAAGESCTLRDALAAFQSSTETEATIVIPPGHYTLTEGELALAKGGTLDLIGAGARRTVIDGAGASRVLSLQGTFVPTAATLDANISNLTITGGAETTAGEDPGDGGGVLFGGQAHELTLRQVAVTGNSATTNGGGIAAPLEGTAKTVVVEDSTVADNKIAGGAPLVGLGGGLFVTGNLTMTNTTVTGNTVENGTSLDEGGGVTAGPGSGTDAQPTQTRIVNSTIAGNSVDTGTGGGFSMYNPTALAESTSTITNTIIAGNSAGGATSNCGGTLTVVSSHDLADDSTCMFTDAASKTQTDPKLGPLANNGGETDTLALLAGSPAIDAGTNEGCPPTDQRGVARPIGSACDIGAYEYQPNATPTTTAPSSGSGSGSGSAGPSAPASADLVLRIKPRPKKPHRGKKLAFRVTIRDVGPSAAPGVDFEATVPAATRKVKVKGLGKKACVLSKAKKHKRKLSCKLGTIDPGKARSFAIPVRTRKGPRKLAVHGTVTSTVADPTPVNAKAKAVARLSG